MPDKMAVVLSFPEPTNGLYLPLLVGRLKEFFADQPEVKIYAGRADVADSVLEIFAPLTNKGQNDSTDPDRV